MKNLYDVLGVNKDATKEQIKKAHRKGVKENHPDKGGDKELFQTIQLAYDILGSDKKREHYDTTGETEIKDAFQERFASFILEVLIPEIEKSDDLNIDLIGHGIGVLREELQKANDAIKEYSKHVEKIEKSILRVSKENEGVNFLSMMIEEKVRQYKSKIAMAQSMVEFYERALEEMREYKYEFDLEALMNKPNKPRTIWDVLQEKIDDQHG